MITKWIALKHKTNRFGHWSISPKDYFELHGSIPDVHANLEIPGMEETMDHTYVSRDGSDGRPLLIRAGLEICDDPVWYFDPRFTGVRVGCDDQSEFG